MLERVYVVILNYNGWEDTIECLESVLKLLHRDFRVVVVDNHSTDGSIQKITDWAHGELNVTTSSYSAIRNLVQPHVKKPIPFKIQNEEFSYSTAKNEIILIKASDNKGFSAGNNIGITHALRDPACKYIWLLNNDTVVPADSLTKLVDYHKMQSLSSKTGIVGHPLIHYHHPTTLQVFAGAFNPLSSKTVHLGENEPVLAKTNYRAYDYPIGASLFVPRDFVEEVGLMDERYFLYFEELDWTKRGNRLGWKTAIASDVMIYHKHGSTTGNNDTTRSLFADKVIIESRVLFYKKHYPLLLPVPFLMLPLILFNRIKRGQANRIFSLIASAFIALRK